MRIPEGYKLVPVDLLERVVCLDNSFRRHRQAQHDLVTFLAAPVPPKVEAQPEAYQYQGRDGKWRGFVNEQHYHSTVADGSWPIRALYSHSDAGVANSNHKLLMDGACGEIALLEQECDALRAQLAERDALLNRWLDMFDGGIPSSMLGVLRESTRSALSFIKEG